MKLSSNADVRACYLPIDKLGTVVEAIREITNIFDIKLTVDPFNKNNVMFTVIMFKEDIEKLGGVLVENADGYVS